MDWLRGRGFNPIPVPEGRKEVQGYSWKQYQTHIMSKEDFDRISQYHPCNVAIVCGQTSGNLYVHASVAWSGNVGKLGNETLVHGHITLSDAQGQAWGGHLTKGTEVFAAELVMTELRDVELVREFDTVTGLNLIKIPPKEGPD